MNLCLVHLIGDSIYSRWVDDVGIYQHAVEKFKLRVKVSDSVP